MPRPGTGTRFAAGAAQALAGLRLPPLAAAAAAVLLLLLLTPPVALPAAAATPKTRVWLVHASTTGGHAAAARAVAQALNDRHDVTAEVFNLLDDMPRWARGLQHLGFSLSTSRYRGARARAFEAAYAGRPEVAASARRWLRLKAFFARSFLRRLQKDPPHVILSTHAQTNLMLARWRTRGKLAVPVHSVVTDYEVHILWADEGIDAYYVATPHVRDRLSGFGIDPGRIRVTGIPVGAGFAYAPPARPANARRSLGLDPQRPAVLMTGGSMGFGPYVEVVEAMESLLADRAAPVRALQFLALTGRNTDLRRRLEPLVDSLRHVQLRVYGYVDTMAAFMDAADAVISKPGGLTVTELMCRRRPMIFVQPAAGIERRVAAAIDALDVVEIVPSAPAAAHRALREALEPRLRAARQRAIDAAVRPRAADEIATALLQAAQPSR